MGGSVPANFVPSRQLQRQFLSTLFRKVLRLTPESNSKSLQYNFPETAVALAALRDIEPLIATGYPELADAFERSKTFAGSLVTNEMLDSIDKQEKRQSEFRMDFDERIKRLEKLDGEGKLTDAAIISLVTSLKTEEQYKIAEFWVLKINESKVREDTFSLFYFNRSQLAVKENRLEDAVKYADKVPELEQRATLYFRVAETELKTNKNRFQMLDRLNDVYKLADKAEDSVGKAQVLFGLAFMYANFDFYRANDCLTAAVRVTNRLENPDIFNNSFVRQIKGKGYSHFAVYSTVGFNMEEVFKVLAEKDFSSILGQAESFSDKYFRTLAVIATIKDCAKPKPETKNKTKPK
jgi:tetratricopeptide (TPR) repeat protein